MVVVGQRKACKRGKVTQLLGRHPASHENSTSGRLLDNFPMAFVKSTFHSIHAVGFAPA